MSAISRRTIAMGLALVLLGCVPGVNAEGRRDIHRTVGNIDVTEGEWVGNLKSLDGSIRLADHSHVARASTVNGSIIIGDGVTIASARTTNGSIHAGESLRTEGDLKTVNGSIRVARGSTVGSNVKTVNGSVHLAGTHVKRDVETVNGDIAIINGSKIDGDVMFRRPDGAGWFRHRTPPTLTVDAGSTIRGTVYLYQRVNLDIAKGAKVGKIVSRYSGGD